MGFYYHTYEHLMTLEEDYWTQQHSIHYFLCNWNGLRQEENFLFKIKRYEIYTKQFCIPEVNFSIVKVQLGFEARHINMSKRSYRSSKRSGFLSGLSISHFTVRQLEASAFGLQSSEVAVSGKPISNRTRSRAKTIRLKTIFSYNFSRYI